MKKTVIATLLMLVVLCPLLTIASITNVAQAVTTFNDTNFRLLWEQVDQPVQQIPNVGRSWTWGPRTLLGSPESEPYNDGTRVVQYFDKARMEVNNPDGDRTNPFFVTNGLLVRELVSGLRQDGDTTFTPFLDGAATIPVAGDPNEAANNFANPNTPTYASFQSVATLNNDHSVLASADSTVIRAAFAKDGSVSTINPPANVKVVAQAYDSVTKHNMVDVFVNFQNQQGQIFDPTKQSYSQGAVYFNNPVFVFGHPITEPYWVNTVVAGKPTLVLVQLFERRVLTYTPSNPAAFQVEMGNIGQHYYDWRYIVNSPANQPTPTPTPVPLYQNDFTQFRADYNKTGNNQIPGEYNPVNYDAGSAIHSSPAVDTKAKLGFFGTDGNGVFAINLTTGAGLWNFKPAISSFYFGSSPIVLNGTVYIGANDGKVYALNETDGSQKWTTPAALGPITATPATDGTYLYVASHDGKVYAYDLATGQNLKWQFNTGAEIDNGPVLGPDGTVFVGNLAGQLFAIKAGEKVWQKTGDGGFAAQASLTTDGAHLYIASLSGTVFSFNTSDGSVQWSNQLTPGFSIYTTPALYEQKLFVGSDNGTEYELNADTGTTNLMWIVKLPNAPHIRSSAAVVDDFVYFGADNNYVYGIEVDDSGLVRVAYATKAKINSNSPVVNNGQLFFTSSDGHFRLLD
jgi:outer membrane protein assembly factor BamB